MDLQELTLKHLRKHPLYNPQHTVRVREISDGWWIGYRTSPSNLTIQTTHFDVNIIKGTFFILHIEIENLGSYRASGKPFKVYLYCVSPESESWAYRVEAKSGFKELPSLSRVWDVPPQNGADALCVLEVDPTELEEDHLTIWLRSKCLRPVAAASRAAPYLLSAEGANPHLHEVCGAAQRS